MRDLRFIVISIAMLALLLVLGTLGVVVVLALIVVVIIGVLALLGLGMALSLAVAVVVLASLWMSGHLGKQLEWRCRIWESSCQFLLCREAVRWLKQQVSEGGGRAYLKQWALGAAEIGLLVIWLPGRGARVCWCTRERKGG